MASRLINVSALSLQISSLHASIVLIQKDIRQCSNNFELSDEDFITKINVLAGMITIMNAQFERLVEFAASQPDDENTTQAKHMLASIRICIEATTNRHKSLVRYRKDCIDTKKARTEIARLCAEDTARRNAHIVEQEEPTKRCREPNCVIL